MIIKKLTNFRKGMNEHSETFNKETKNIRKYQTGSYNELKNKLDGFNIRMDEKEAQISK